MTKYKLTWAGDKTRWQFMRDGVLYRQSCRQMVKAGLMPYDVPHTKEASYPYARRWQAAVLGELNKAAELQIEVFGRAHANAVKAGDTRSADIAQEMGRILKAGVDVPPEAMTAILNGLRTVPRLEIRDYTEEATPPRPEFGTPRLGQAVDKWLADAVKPRSLLPQDVKGSISPREYINHEYGIKFLRNFFEEDDLTKITEVTWQTYYAYLCELIAKGTYSSSYCQNAWKYSRAFMEHAYKMGWHPGLKNLRNRTMVIGGGAAKKEFFTNEEVATLLTTAKGQLRLHILLMLNCCYTQKDIADLLDDEVDWERGRIKRIRSKGQKRETVPEVSYKLWEPTFRLLKQYRSGGKYVLVTQSGNRWVEGTSDNFATLYDYMRTETGIDKPPKCFRKTSSNRVENNRRFKLYVQLILGQSDGTVASRHYVAPADSTLDPVLDWLYRDLGLDKLTL